MIDALSEEELRLLGNIRGELLNEDEQGYKSHNQNTL